MKKGIRIAVIVILFLAGAGVLTWYLMMRREVPRHARCIPKDVIAVLTLNVRELALDNATGGHLFPEFADKKSLPKELEPFQKAIEQNDGAGLAQTADVLGFFYRDGDMAFFGVAASVKDSAKFGKLLREQLTKQLSIRSFSLQKVTMVRFDTSAAVLGWNNETALFLYPFGNQTAAQTADQCAKLLTQAEEQSVLADENFREHELSSFDAGIWMQPKKLLEFSQGGDLLKTAFDNVKYLSLAMDFQDGELIMRKIITQEKISSNVNYNSSVLLTCDPKQVLGFYHDVMNLQNESLLESYADIPPLNMLPLNDERSKQLTKYMDGNYTLLVHDTFTFDMDYITYDYDEDFNRIPKHETKKETQRGYTTNFELKDKTAAQNLLTIWMKADSVPLINNTWTTEYHNTPCYVTISNNVLSVSNWKQTDGKAREVPEAWAGLDMFIPIDKLVIPEASGTLSFFIPQMGNGEKLLSDNFENLLVSTQLVTGNQRSSQIRVTMHNKEVNALVQMEELFGKIMSGN
jgi:hypothetical protein